MRPTCCDKRCTPYRKDYGWSGFEEGFRCRWCGRIRVPDTEMVERIAAAWPAIEAGMERLRLAGIESDQESFL